MWPAMKNELSAIPVTIPGSAIGRTSRNETASRPKNANRATAEGRGGAEDERDAGGYRPTRTDSQIAPRTSGSSTPTWNQCVVKPAIGQLCTFDLSNAYNHDQRQRQPEEERRRGPTRPRAPIRVERWLHYNASNVASLRASRR